MKIIKDTNEVTANTEEFSVRVIENEQGIIVDVYIRHGELIQTNTYWKEDFFENDTECHICGESGKETCSMCQELGHMRDESNKTCEMCVKNKLEYLRGEIEAERISYGEIAELQGLAAYIDKDDTVLLEWAGVPESTK
jgi:hypothetical protein